MFSTWLRLTTRLLVVKMFCEQRLSIIRILIGTLLCVCFIVTGITITYNEQFFYDYSGKYLKYSKEYSYVFNLFGSEPLNRKHINSTNGTIKLTFDMGLFHVEYPEVWADDASFQSTILDQLPYVSKLGNTRNNYNRLLVQTEKMRELNRTLSKQNNRKQKLIYFHVKDSWVKAPNLNSCPVICNVTVDIKLAKLAEAVVFLNVGNLPDVPIITHSDPKQVWAILISECPNRSFGMTNYKDMFNWTLTYRHDSVISSIYSNFYFLSEPKNKTFADIIEKTNYAEGKSRQVAWIVSNCVYTKSGRMKYAKELQKYIHVDIFGKCGIQKCPSNQFCEDLLRKKYKFYLSFENHRCKEYMSEKAMRPFS